LVEIGIDPSLAPGLAALPLASNAMSDRAQTFDVAVVGGGVIGLACAWRARRSGCSVVVLESHAIGERCASYVAAGMLAPISEVEFGEAGRRALDLGLRSAELWPELAVELRQATGVDVGLRRSGTLVVARDADEARELERQLALREQLGLRVRRLRGSEARELEPGLAPGVRLALEAPDDHSVDPRRVLSALRRACETTGVVLREHAAVSRVELGGPDGGVRGVRLADGDERVAARSAVLAAGAWTGGIEGLPEQARPAVRPVRGQILRLRDPAGPGLLSRVLRFEGGYLVPRDHGRYVLGATMEERDFESRPTVGGVYELLRQARELLPGVLELEIEEVSVGFRPATPDNAPVIGPAGPPGVVWATGHHRNGILLAPITAALVAEALAAGAPPPETPACERFAAGEAMPA
jgi:glycine oxidase